MNTYIGIHVSYICSCLSLTFFCLGTGIAATIDSNRTGVPSIFHVNCEILIAQGSQRCCCCKRHRKSLCAMATRNHKDDDRTNPSSHTNYSCLNPAEKDVRMARIHKETRKLSSRVAQLEDRLAAAVISDGVTLTNELNDDMIKITTACTKKVYSTFPEGSFQRLFWDQQVKANNYKNCKSMKWHPLFIKWSLCLRHLSGKSYELLRKSDCIKLPSQSTLRDYTHYIPAKVRFSTEVDQNLVDIAFLSNNLNKYVILVMDEMHIKHDLVYDKHSGSLIGFVDLGNTNNQILEFEQALAAEKTEKTLASTMLVFMVRGLVSSLNYPYAQFACSDINGSQMMDPMWEAVPDWKDWVSMYLD